MKRRVILLVLDSVGVGQAPDASAYGDELANTIAHTAEAVQGLHIPHMESLGLGCITPIKGVSDQSASVRGAYGYMIPQSAGKDTTNGHLEFVGVTLREPLPTYPSGFPQEIIEPFERAIGKKVLANCPASGTEIIRALGAIHERTGRPIVYTSGDSVFQIAAHEAIISPAQLYGMCEIARSLLTGAHAVGRVIARPFVGAPGAYVRTGNRKDFSRDFGPTLLTALEDTGIPVTGIGKIADIYSHQGITHSVHTANNEEGVDATVGALDSVDGSALIFTNLVDFDALYGHRNDAVGFARAIESFDRRLPELLTKLTPDDLLILTADHGCDPTTLSTDHSREGVPLLVFQSTMTEPIPLGRRDTYADLGATIADYFAVPWLKGTSFYKMLQKG